MMVDLWEGILEIFVERHRVELFDSEGFRFFHVNFASRCPECGLAPGDHARRGCRAPVVSWQAAAESAEREATAAHRARRERRAVTT